VRRRGVVVEDGCPPTRERNETSSAPRNIVRSGEMEGGLLNGYGVKPDDVAVIVGQPSVVGIVAPRMVRLEMPMNC